MLIPVTVYQTVSGSNLNSTYKYLNIAGLALSVQSNPMDVRSKPFFFSGILLPDVYMRTRIYILESPILKEGTLFKVYIQKIYQNVLMFAIC